MTQANDLGAIVNQRRDAYRQRLNENFQALATQNAGIAAPVPSYPFMTYVDTAAGKLRMRDAANTVWLTVADLGPSIRWLSAGDRTNVLSFGAKGDGVADDTAAIIAAIAAMPVGGGRLCFPAGTYKVTSTIPLTKPGVYVGDGAATVIKAASASANVFDVVAPSVTVSDIAFDASVARTGGAYVRVAAGDCRIRKFWMTRAWTGIQVIDGVAVVTIGHGYLHDGVAASGVGVLIDGGVVIRLRGLIMDSVPSIAACVRIRKGNSISIESCGLMRGDRCLDVSVGAGDVLNRLICTNTFFDTAFSHGVLMIAGGAGAAVANASFRQCWFASAGQLGMSLNTVAGGAIDGVDVSACHGFGNGVAGIGVGDGGISNVRINGGAYAGNGGSGISFSNGVNQFAVVGARVGPSHGFGPNGYGIFVVGPANDDYTIAHNDLRGNVSGALADGGTGARKVVGNNL